MAVNRKTINFLPEIFRTDTNKKFLGSTLDQLISEPELKKINGFIGRKFSPSIRSDTGFILEKNKQRQDYQLEPGVVIKNNRDNIDTIISYADIINKLKYYGAITNDHSRLFNSEYYNFDPHIDLDKFVNYGNYHWNKLSVLPTILVSGFKPIQLSNISLTRNGNVYSSSISTINNPPLYLARGKTYTLNVTHNIGEGNLWLQTEPSLTGTTIYNNSLSVREIFGVSNNGVSTGNITISVPMANAQKEYFKYALTSVDLAITNTFTSSDNAVYTSGYYPDNKLVIFVDSTTVSSDWVDRNGATLTNDQRHGIWLSRVVNDGSATLKIQYTFVRNLSANTRVIVESGINQGKEYLKTTNGFITGTTVTAPFDKIYYQNDQTDIRGEIFFTQDIAGIHVINDIIDELFYTSPGGIEFINGMKIQFDNFVEPEQYREKSFYVEGVSKGIKLIPADVMELGFLQQPVDSDNLISAPEDYITINRASRDLNAWSRSNRWIHKRVIEKLKIQYPELISNSVEENKLFPKAIRPIIEFEPDLQLLNHGRGFYTTVDHFHTRDILLSKGASLVPLENPMTQIQGLPYHEIRLMFPDFIIGPGDTIIFESDINQNNRNKIYKLGYQNQIAQTEFRSIINGGITGKVDSPKLAGLNSQKPTNFGVDVVIGDSIFLNNGTLLGTVENIFSSNELILDRSLTVNINDLDNLKVNYGLAALTQIDTVSFHQSVFVTGGPNGQGINAGRDAYMKLSIRDNSLSGNREIFSEWMLAQSKIKTNQEPLFDIILDNDAMLLGSTPISIHNISLSSRFFDNSDTGVVSTNATKIYPKNNFSGTKIFSYAYGSSTPDAVLGFPLSYNVAAGFIGDINFINNYDTDTFTYKTFINGNQTLVTENINTGFLRKNTGFGDTDCIKLNVWSPVGHNEPKPIIGTRLSNTVNSSSIAKTLENEINIIYNVYLGRYPSQNELNQAILDNLVAYINSGKYSLTGLETTIKNSSEAKSYNPYNYILDFTKQLQHRSYVFDGYTSYFELGVKPYAESSIPDVEPNIKVFINNRYVTPNSPNTTIWTYKNFNARHAIVIDPKYLKPNDKIDILFSGPTDNNACYQIPQNLEFNYDNEDVTYLTHGQMRGHYERIAQNIRALVGEPLGDNNLNMFDTNNRGGTILQHSAPMTYCAAFLVDEQANLMSSIDYARREYTKFKNKLLEIVVNDPNASADNVSYTLDNAIQLINKNKNVNDFSFYYSDMLAHGSTGEQIVITVLNSSTNTYNLSGLIADSIIGQDHLIYHNNNLLINNHDYVLNDVILELKSHVKLAINDTIIARIYKNTLGSYVPETPTKLGMYPHYLPSIIIDDTLGEGGGYVIQGHDGSLTPAFNDIRDQVLLEFEKRIYNNLKIFYNPDIIDLHSIIPGHFRHSEYTLTEFNQVINSEFLKWIGFNHLDYAANSEYNKNDSFTFNYSRCRNEQGNSLPGHWRGIYKFYYDTDRPHTHPWEMLGHTIKPTWWDSTYSWSEPVKRTALINSITKGLVGNPITDTKSVRWFSRPGFDKLIPVDSSGNLISPNDLMVSEFDSTSFGRNFIIGDHGPAETAWRRSSEFSYSLIRAMALLKPARFFAQNIDHIRYSKFTIGDTTQFAHLETKKRPAMREFKFNGEITDNGNVVALGYLNWIHGYLVSLGIDPNKKLRNILDQIQVNLVYKLGGFSDKKYLNIFAEQFAPDSVAESVLIPDQNFTIHLNKSVPVDRAVYSAVIIERSGDGFTVTGYDQRYPYFTIIPSEIAGKSYTIEALDKRATIFTEFRPEKIIIPYGYEFSNHQQIVDFLVGYQRYLIAQGFVFDIYDKILAVVRDWILSAKEFLTWCAQGWKTGNILILSPVIDRIIIQIQENFVDEITNQLYQSRLLGANFNSIRPSDFTVLRDGQRTTIATISGQTIALIDINFVEFEHVIVFDNKTIFGDTVYNPTLGNRQYKMRLTGSKTDNWDGTLTPSGFVYTSADANEWTINELYNKGDIVSYKNKLYTAIQKIEPSENFNINYWKELDTIIESGIIPNFAQLAVRGKDIYDVDALSLDEEFIKFGTSLIGYRSRSNLVDLGMNETTQIKFYQGYIKEKGTRNVIDALVRGNFDNINNKIEIYEEWGARIGAFGGIDVNPEIIFPISKSLVKRNPLIFEFLNFGNKPNYEEITAIYPNQLLTRPYDYDNKIFLNRNEQNINLANDKNRLVKIEIFGDGIMCGQRPSDLVAYSISAVENFNYSVEITGDSSYMMRAKDENGELIFNPSGVGGLLNIDINTLTNNEQIEYEIISADGTESQLSVSSLVDSSIDTLITGQPFKIVVTSILPEEQLSIDIETPQSTDALLTKTRHQKLVKKIEAAINEVEKRGLKFLVTGINDTETLYYSIEDAGDPDDPLSSTYVDYGTACIPLEIESNDGLPINSLSKLNLLINRVEIPPADLIYQALSQDVNMAITTRSVGGSSSFDILFGDGANSRWPDGIDADIVIINHGLYDARNNTDIANYKNNLSQLRLDLPRKVKIIWVLPTATNNNLTNENSIPDPRVRWNKDNRLQLYINAMREVAITYGDYVADTTKITNWNEYLNIDPIFPDQNGYRALVEEVLASVIKNVIRDNNLSSQITYEDDVISAGYVLENEVNEMVFDATKFTISVANIDKYNTGYKIWFAKDFNEEWQVYRLFLNKGLIVLIEPDLNDRYSFVFDHKHSFLVNDLIFVKNIDILFDGIHRIISVTDNTVVVQGTTKTTRYLQYNTREYAGQYLDFQPLRFKTEDELKSANPRHHWLNTDLIFLDDNGLGNWEVLRPSIYSYANIESVINTVRYDTQYQIWATNNDNRNTDQIDVVTVANIKDEIKFSVISMDDKEDLYWTIEEVNEEDEVEIQIEKFFYLYLNRKPSTDELSYYKNIVLDAKSATIEDLEERIKSGPEARLLGARANFNFGNIATVTSEVSVTVVPKYRYQRVRKQTKMVDIDSANNFYIFSNKQKRILARMDIYDPAKGRILGTAQQDLDYTISADPAMYNKYSPNNTEIGFDNHSFWGPEKLGVYWWNLDNCRFVNYEHGDLIYRANNWGRLFPGSKVEIYEWIESDKIPSVHLRLGLDGVPLYPDDSAYSEKVIIDLSSVGFKSKYYFWVRGSSLKRNKSKRHSTSGLEKIIKDPIAQNIPFLVALKDNAVALYNAGQFLDVSDTLVYISSKRKITENIVHTNFALIQEGNTQSSLPVYLEEKIIDSLAGVDRYENPVPDPTLPTIRRYGIEAFPRQSAIINQLKARENIVKYINSVLLKYPLKSRTESKSKFNNFFTLQNPKKYQYNIQVPTFAHLSDIIPDVRNRVLVLSDETLGNFWSIYETKLIASNQTSSSIDYSKFKDYYVFIKAVFKGGTPPLYDYYGYFLKRRQSYQVRKHWDIVRWYAPGITSKTVPDYTLNTSSDLLKYNFKPGDIVKILNTTTFFDSTVNFLFDVTTETGRTELYKYNLSEGKLVPELVALDEGTFQLSDEFYKPLGFDSDKFDSRGFDYDVNREFRFVLESLKYIIFVDDLAIEWNKILYYIIDLILAEQKYIDWFFKTSFIAINHVSNGLKQNPGYVKDKQKNFAEYINEVKPYRTKIREYKLSYNNLDNLRLGVTDFDVPAVWVPKLNDFRTPNGEELIDQTLWTMPVYQDWIKNHGYYVDRLAVVHGGYNYFNKNNNIGFSPRVELIRQDFTTGNATIINTIVHPLYNFSIMQTNIIRSDNNFLTAPKSEIFGRGGNRFIDNTVFRFMVISKGSNDTNTGPGMGLYQISYPGSITAIWTGTTNGYILHKIRRTDGVLVSTEQFLLDTDVIQASLLASSLANTTSDHIIVLHTLGNPKVITINDQLTTQITRCGGNKNLFEAVKSNSSYILVGIPDCGETNGIENYSGLTDNSTDAYCTISFNLYRTRLIPITAVPAIFSINNLFSFPVPNSNNNQPYEGQSVTHYNKSWIYNGKGWEVAKSPVGLLPNEVESRAAVLVPIIENRTVRKIKLTIKFDRISYYSSVQEWQPGLEYQPGTLLSYSGRGYRVFNLMSASAKFNYGAVTEILDHSYYTNANDRIMSLYVSKYSNFNIPKSLIKLVPGLEQVGTYLSTIIVDPDTILIGDTFGSNIGISAGNIRVTGGSFVDELLTRSPEELVPGIVFDTLTIKVHTSITAGFRMFKNFANVTTGTAFSAATTTTLTSPILLFNTNISVTNGSTLTPPSVITSGGVTVNVIPGVIQVNGERIAYFNLVGNTLSQLRRGYEGTSIANEHPSGSIVEDVSVARASTLYNTDYSIPIPPVTTGEIEFKIPGTYLWSVPSNVSAISVVGIGGGGAGAIGTINGGGGGGALAWVNNIPVNRNQIFTVVVGEGGKTSGANGTASYLTRSSTIIFSANGGSGSKNISSAAGGTFSVSNAYGTSGGGAGGAGGESYPYAGAGGGGAGGYNGAGGTGGSGGGPIPTFLGTSKNAQAGTNGSGGGGGGGAGGNRNTFVAQGGGGGGVGIYGIGSSGIGGTVAIGSDVGGYGGTAGSSGNNGSDGTGGEIGSNGGSGGIFGGGGGGAASINGDETNGYGGNGAVRIIWGTGRSFPSANVNPLYVTSTTSTTSTTTRFQTVPTTTLFTPSFYSEDKDAFRYVGNWSKASNYTMRSITNFGEDVNMHGPESGSYVLTIDDLPVHTEYRFSFYMHFVDSLDNELSVITLNNTIYAQLTKNLYNVPSFSTNLFAATDFSTADYSYAPWGNNQTVNGYTRFDTGWVTHTANVFIANIFLGHDQSEIDEAIYFSHIKLELRGGITTLASDLPLPPQLFTVHNLTVPTGYALVSNTYTANTTITVPLGVSSVQVTARGANGIRSNPTWINGWETGVEGYGPVFATVTDTSAMGLISGDIENSALSQYNLIPSSRTTEGSNVSIIHYDYDNNQLVTTTYTSRVRLKIDGIKTKLGNGWNNRFITPITETKIFAIEPTYYEEYLGGIDGADLTFSNYVFPGGIKGNPAPVVRRNIPVVTGINYNITVPPGGEINIQYLKPLVYTVADPNPLRAKVYRTPGVYSWTCPTGITQISVICIGAGGGGSYTANGGSGGGGGGVGWKNKITVVPGNNYTVSVGSGGDAPYAAAGQNGGDSYFDNKSTVCGFGGGGGDQIVKGSQGGHFIGQSGGSGGNGGKNGGGGGGAAGWTSKGANGGIANNDGDNGMNGAGGGGAGFNAKNEYGGGGGGGVGLIYSTVGGNGGTVGTLETRHGLGNGGNGQSGNGYYLGGAQGGLYGGGGSGGALGSGLNPFGGRGAGGAVIIFYGTDIQNNKVILPNITSYYEE